MDHLEFGEGMTRLKNQWSSAFGDERIKLIYSYVRTLNKSQWLDIVDQCLSEFKFAPLPAEIASLARRKQNGGSFVVGTLSHCHDCSDSGWSIIGGEGVPDVKRCDCTQ